MPSKNINDLLSELEEAEKTAEEVFTSEIIKEDEETSKEKVASEEEVVDSAEETEEEVEEKTASEEEEIEDTASESEEEVEEKTASEEDTDEEETTKEASEKEEEEKTASTDKLSAEDLVKIAKDMGKVMAHSAYSELVSMGIMPATNDDVVVPPISQVSLPMDSPVTVAADAKEQMGQGQEKKASGSDIKEQALTNLYKTYFPEEE